MAAGVTFGNPWEVARPDARHVVGLGGAVQTRTAAEGRTVFIWQRGDGGRGGL